jgi:hypothetical protein
MDNALRNALAIEVRVLFKQLPILHQQGPTRASRHSILVITDGNPRGGGQGLLITHDTVLFLSTLSLYV